MFAVLGTNYWIFMGVGGGEKICVNVVKTSSILTVILYMSLDVMLKPSHRFALRHYRFDLFSYHLSLLHGFCNNFHKDCSCMLGSDIIRVWYDKI